MGLNYQYGGRNGAYAVNSYFINASDKREQSRENEKLKDKAAPSEIAMYMNKNKNFPTINPGEEWKITYYKNKAILATIIFHYLFTNDDGLLSRKEISMTEKYLKRNHFFYSDEDKKFFAGIPIPYKKEDLLKYMLDHNMKNDIFGDALKDVKSVIKKDFSYRIILTKLSDYIHDNIK